jgi:hypothetical protein
MKANLLVVAVLASGYLHGQDLFNRWLKTEVVYLDNSRVSNRLIPDYLRYFFEKPNKVYVSVAYEDKGADLFFEKKGDIIEIKNSAGFMLNSFMVAELGPDQLVMIQKGPNGFSDDECLKYYFAAENIRQNSLPLRPGNIASIRSADTVYNSSEKIHPEFNLEKPFHDFCSENISELTSPGNGVFIATFVVRKTGIIDSVKILAAYNRRFEKQFLSALKKSQKFWLPGKLNGKNVDVQVKTTFQWATKRTATQTELIQRH